MEEPVTHEAVPIGSSSKPIKKRVAVQDDRDRDDYDAFDHRSYDRKESSNQESTSAESRARKDLLGYISSKGVDASKEIQSYKVSVKLGKNERHNDSRRSTQTITYTAPNGQTYTSKADVFDALRLSKNRNVSSRAEMYSAATKKYNSFVRNNNFPVDIDGIRVIHLGDINSEECSLHSSVDIHPVGYDAEVTLQTVNRGRSSTSRVRCEIMMKNGQPEFRITPISNDQIYTASSESAAWRKYDPQGDFGSTPSFFNLQIELLIEGMTGADCCSDYKFHEERGYKDTYFNQSDASIAKQSYVSKQTKDSRNQRKEDREQEKKSFAADRDRKDQEKENLKRKRGFDKEMRDNMKRDEAMNRESKKMIIRNTRETKEESKKRKGEMNDKNKIRSQYRKDFSSDLKRIRGDANVLVLQYFDEEENLEEQEQHIKLSPSSLPVTTSTISKSESGSGSRSISKNLSETGDSIKDLKSGSKSSVGNNVIAGHEARENFFLSLPSCDESFQLCSSSSVASTYSISGSAIDSVLNSSKDIHTTATTTEQRDSNDSIVQTENSIKLNAKINAFEGYGGCSGLNWDDLFQMINCLYAFNDFLLLQMPIRLEGVIDRVAKVTSVGNYRYRYKKNSDPIKSQNSILLASDTGSEENKKHDVGTNVKKIIESSTNLESVSLILATKIVKFDQEDEWDESDYKKPANSSGIGRDPGSDNGMTIEDADREGDRENSENRLAELLKAQADLDRMHLCLLNSLSSDLHSLLDLDESDKGSAVRFPLNQLTWPELARMVVTAQVLTDQGRGREDIQQALRGSRQPNYRIAKNVVRYIRYRLAVRVRAQHSISRSNKHDLGDEDRLCQLGEDMKASLTTSVSTKRDLALADEKMKIKSLSLTSSNLIIKNEKTNFEEIAVYNSESELISALTSASTDPLYTEMYQRCCKVLIKIANLNQAKHFFWEVDSVMYPDYYSSINKPIMIANVTSSLIRQLYGNDDNIVGNLFYTDLKQIALNCFSYNTEVTAVHAQAQKLYQVLQYGNRTML